MNKTSKPNRLSPFYHKQTSLGAKFIQDQLGWSRPERFSDPNEEKNRAVAAVGLYDLSQVVKLSLKHDDIAETISNLYKRKVKTGDLIVDGPDVLNNTICAVVTNDEAVIITNSSSNMAVRELLSHNSGLQVIDVSSVMVGLFMVGGKSREVLSKLTELNVNRDVFPNLTATHAALHHVQCMLLRMDLGNLTGYQIYFERAYGEYMWHIISLAGKEFDMAPIGSSAVELLGWRLG